MPIVNGNAIVELRKQKGMDQKTLAEKAGINASVLSRLERNLQADFHISVLVQIADVLEVSIDSLVNRSYTGSSTNDIDPDWQLVVELLNQQPRAIQKQAAAIIRGYISSLSDQNE